MSDTNVVRGYGLSKTHQFSGDGDQYELWEIKFKAYLRLNKLKNVLEESDPDVEKNAEVYAILVQLLDDKSLNLIIRDAEDNGKKALQILREHYLGTSKPKIISLYTELTSLKMGEDSVTEYMLKAETAASRLKQAGEEVSDGLLIAMILKGLPESFKAFRAIVLQMDESKMNFQKFKSHLRSYEECEDEKLPTSDNVFNIKCYSCGKPGHIKSQCTAKKGPNSNLHGKARRWCDHCMSSTHDTSFCRKHGRNNFSNKNVDKSANISNSKPRENYMFKVSVNENEKLDNNKYLIDCGATCHILSDKNIFINFDKDFNSNEHVIELADKTRQQGVVIGRGDAMIEIKDTEGNLCNVLLVNALCVPSYRQNILSVNSMSEKGMKVIFSEKENKIVAPDGKIFQMYKYGKLYYLNSCFSSVESDKVSVCRPLQEWHNVMGHCNVSDILSLEKVCHGMKIKDKVKFECETCIKGKMCLTFNHKPDEKASAPLDLIHSDLTGLIEPRSLEGSGYCVSFVDDFSGLIFVYFLKKKSDTADAMQRFLADIAPYGKVKRFRSDGGGEYMSNEFKKIMIENQIKHEFSAPRSPHQNGTAERAWKTLFDMARCMLFEYNLPKTLWTYAVRYAAYIRNRCFSRQISMTPFEKFTGKKPSIDKIQEFGSKCFSYNYDRSKLDTKAVEGTFVGQDPSSPAFLIYNVKKNKVSKARCVKFLKNHEVIPTLPESSDHDDDNEDDLILPMNLQCDPVPVVEPSCVPEEESNVIETQDGNINVNSKPTPSYSGIATENLPVTRYPKRNRKPPTYLDDYASNLSASDASSGDYNSVSDDSEYYDEAKCFMHYCYKMMDVPVTYNDAVQSPNSKEWQNAMELEMDALIDNDTFDLVPKPNKPVIGGRWVFALKYNEDGKEICKARFVAKGFTQRKDIDYDETFSPTARLTSIRVLLQLAINHGYKIRQLDVKSAYLNADLDYDIYIYQPKGFEKLDGNGNPLVMKLKKSLYGLKQSGRMWNKMFHDFLTANDFCQSKSDYCLYIKNSSNDRVYLIVWVDDIIMISNNDESAECVKNLLISKFRMKDFGKISYFLGIEFELYDGFIKMHQSKYVDKLLTKFGLSDCKYKTIPCDHSTVNVDFNDTSPTLTDPSLYRQMVGSLIYLMTCSRPDLSYVVTVLSQHMSKPTAAHLNIAKHVLRYLKFTADHGIIFKASDKIHIEGFTDASWANADDRRSISGYCFSLSSGGALVSWKTKKQPIIALSSCESEYVAMTHGIQEAMFLKQLLIDLLVVCNPDQVYLHVDNMGAIDLGKNPVHHQRTKHVDIKYHFIRSKIQDGTVVLKYVPSKENVADIFTKPSTRMSLNKFVVTS